MSPSEALAAILALGGLTLLIGVPAAGIVAVAAFSQMRGKDPAQPKSTGARSLFVAIVGHVMGVVTGLCALCGVPGSLLLLGQPSPSALQEIGAYALFPLTGGGLLLAPSLFFVGLAIARGGGTKTRASVLAVALWVALHHLLATGTLLLLVSSSHELGVFLLCLVPAAIGIPHALALTWVGLARIGERVTA